MEQIEEQTSVAEMENGSTVTVQQGQALPQSSAQTSMPPPMQTPSVIQTNQQSVIQTAQSIHSASIQGQQIGLAQAVQGVTDPDDSGVLDEESKKRRDILSRRPSYRYTWANEEELRSIRDVLVSLLSKWGLCRSVWCDIYIFTRSIRNKEWLWCTFFFHLWELNQIYVEADARYYAKLPQFGTECRHP